MSASTVGALPYRFAARHRKMREFAGTQSVLKFFLGLLGSVREITDRDDNGFRALSALPDRGVNLAANALAQSADRILSFFRMLRRELAFYVVCLNLHHPLAGNGEPACCCLRETHRRAACQRAS